MIRRSFLKAFALPFALPVVSSGRGKKMPFGNAVGEGFVNPGIVVAKKVIVEGPNQGVLVYSGTPALGNLINSVGSGDFNDQVGNLVLQGNVTYTEVLSNLWLAQAQIGADTVVYSAPAESGPWTQIAQLSWNSLGYLNLQLAEGGSAPSTGAIPQAGGSGITTVAQVVAKLEAMGLLTP